MERIFLGVLEGDVLGDITDDLKRHQLALTSTSIFKIAVTMSRVTVVNHPAIQLASLKPPSSSDPEHMHEQYAQKLSAKLFRAVFEWLQEDVNAATLCTHLPEATVSSIQRLMRMSITAAAPDCLTIGQAMAVCLFLGLNAKAISITDPHQRTYYAWDLFPPAQFGHLPCMYLLIGNRRFWNWAERCRAVLTCQQIAYMTAADQPIHQTEERRHALGYADTLDAERALLDTAVAAVLAAPVPLDV